METLKTIWDFFQNEILGMAWLNRLIGSLLNALGLDTNEKIGGSVQFFIYDMIKIMVSRRPAGASNSPPDCCIFIGSNPSLYLYEKKKAPHRVLSSFGGDGGI